MFRRPRPGGGRHPPPLAPTVSNFKPRAQWSTLESSMFLNINLPGFYMDQIKITKDERARTINIEGQRPLSTQTKARFKEVYRVPESCDMTKLNTSFSHGLLTIEFPVIVESEKAGMVAQDKGKTVQRPNHEGNRGTGGPDGGSVRRSRLSDKENQVGTSQEKAGTTAKKEEPKTYKSALEGKREVPSASRVKPEQKVKEGEASPSLGRKEHTKQEKVVEKKEAAQMGQQKTVQKLKDDAARSTPSIGGSLKAKVQEEKVTERKKDGDMGRKKTEQKVKEDVIAKTPTIGDSSERKVHAKAEKVVEKKGDGEIGQKLKEERKTGVGQKKEEKHTLPAVGNEARRTEKEIPALNQAKPEVKTRERVERTTPDVNGNMITKNDEKMVGDKVSKGETIQEGVREQKAEEEEAGLVKETRDLKDNPQDVEPNKVDSGGLVKKDSAIGGEDREEMVEKNSGSETVPLLAEGQKETNVDPPAAEGSGLEKQETHKYDISLVNVGVASLVIMVFGAYVFVPLVKMFY